MEKYKHIKHIFVDEGECLPTEMLEDLCLIYLRSNSSYSAQRTMKLKFYEEQSFEIARKIWSYTQNQPQLSIEQRSKMGYFWIMSDYLQNYNSIKPFPIR